MMKLTNFFCISILTGCLIGFQGSCAHSTSLLAGSPKPAVTATSPAPDPSEERGRLVASALVATYTAEELQKRYSRRDLPVKTGVEVHRIVYRTGVPFRPGEMTDASGVIVYPTGDHGTQSVLPWLSLQHGTITGDEEAPSAHLGYGLAEGSQGFVTAVQDYIGYGASRHLFHPYMIADTYVDSGIDMLRATRMFVRSKGHDVGPLFLQGYSEGGYATMALQRAIEEHYGHEFSLTASAPAAGPYDLVITSKVLAGKQKASPVNLPFVVLSYDHWFRQEPPLWDLSQVLRNPPGEMYQLFDGRHASRQIYEMLPHETLGLFHENFIQDTVQDAPQTVPGRLLRRWLTQESLTNKGWSPKTPTRIYHCIDDTVVPIEAAKSAWTTFKDLQPAAPVEAVFIVSPDPQNPYDHGNCPVFLRSLTWLASFKR